MLYEVAAHPPALDLAIAWRGGNHRARAVGRVTRPPQRTDRAVAGQQPERRVIGDRGHDAARQRFDQRVAAAFMMAADTGGSCVCRPWTSIQISTPRPAP